MDLYQPEPAEVSGHRTETNSREAAAHGAGAAKIETCEYATDVAVAATPVSREIAQLQPKTNQVVQLHRRALVPIREQVLLKFRRYVPLAGVAAIVFLLVAIVWPPATSSRPITRSRQ
jgi:hypothetical protein